MYIYKDNIGKVDLVDHMGDDLRVINAARVSYGNHKTKFDDKDEKLLQYLIKNKHHTPFEHCKMTFKFKVPLFVRGQHFRHRVWAFSEVSRRFTAKNLEFYYPEKWRLQDTNNKQGSIDELDCQDCDDDIKEVVDRSLLVYNKMLDQGIARELARMVLPQNLYTEYYGTVDLRNAFSFLELRLHTHAQWEIQQVAIAMKHYMNKLFPICMRFWNEVNV